MTNPMTLAEVQAEIDAIAALMVEKDFTDPCVEARFRSGQRQGVVITFANRMKYDPREYEFFPAEDVRDALAKARDWVEDQPTGEEKAIREYMDAVGAAIDIGTKHSIAEEYVAPLRLTRKAMSDNLLTAQAAE